MAVNPIALTDAGVAIFHDERGHGGTVPWADLAFPADASGQVRRDYIRVPCPVAGCDAHSDHPAAGGSAPEVVQALFVAYYLRHPDVPAETEAQAFALARAASDALDGPARWRLGASPGAPPTQRPPVPTAQGG